MKPAPCSWMLGSLTALAIIPVAGCGSRGDGRITIQGTITLDGKPLSEGQVVFVPVDPARGAAGGTIVGGTFAVTTYRGLHKVEVYSVKQQSRRGNEGDEQPVVDLVNVIPARYGEKTTLAWDVKMPDDRPAFTLTSRP